MVEMSQQPLDRESTGPEYRSEESLCLLYQVMLGFQDHVPTKLVYQGNSLGLAEDFPSLPAPGRRSAS